MANQISNHFAITALQEGITVQGSLRINGNLTQNFSVRDGIAIPDWKANASTRPQIYPVVRRGSVYMSKDQIYEAKCYYNDIEIKFDETTGKSTNFKDSAGDPLFQRGEISMPLGDYTYKLDAVTIIGNLASEGNTDIDTISYQGSVELNGHQVPFPLCSVDVKIGQMSTKGYLGVISPESAIITSRTGSGSSVEIEASLYDENGQPVPKFYTKWTDYGANTEIANSTDKTKMTFTHDMVWDNLLIRVDFYSDAAHKDHLTTAFGSIDDQQDPDQLYISFDGKNGDSSGQLSQNESVTVTMWVGDNDDPATVRTEYNNFSVRFYDGSQAEITSGCPTVSVSNHKATCSIGYAFVQDHGYKVTGIVTAS